MNSQLKIIKTHFPITHEELTNKLKSQKCRKSCGPDSILGEMLKHTHLRFRQLCSDYSTLYLVQAVFLTSGAKDSLPLFTRVETNQTQTITEASV